MTQQKPHVLILGATSDIARATARRFAEAGHPIVLAARRGRERLQPDLQDLSVRYGIEASALDFDVTDIEDHGVFLDALSPMPEIVICALGLLGDQTQAQADPQQARDIMEVNYLAPCLLLGEIAERLERAGRGCIVGIGSVAGDRGRAKNYIYGSAKAGFGAFLSGLRNRLDRKGVQVLTVKPGFVDTRMTAGMDLPKALTAMPEEVGEAIYRAVSNKSDVIYVKRRWWLVMTIIRLLPERLFKRLDI